MLAVEAPFLEGIVLGLVFGAAIAAPTAYILTARFKKLNSAVAFYEGKEAALREFRVERFVTPREQGLIWKEYFVVISERLILQDRPVSPFWEHKIPVREELDTKAIEELTACLAKATDKLLGLAGLRAIVSEFLKSKVGGVLMPGDTKTKRQ
jgi:hypothetical protein